jgi:hypothetical protein
MSRTLKKASGVGYDCRSSRFTVLRREMKERSLMGNSLARQAEAWTPDIPALDPAV